MNWKNKSWITIYYKVLYYLMFALNIAFFVILGYAIIVLFVERMIS